MTLADILKGREDVMKNMRRRSEPVWRGPEEDGITYGLLSRFLVCRERFRLLAVEGLRPVDRWEHRKGYGDMWHVCEEALAFVRTPGTSRWLVNLTSYARDLCVQYPLQQESIDHWYNVCRVQFPEYVRWWECHPDVRSRKPLLQEQVFDVHYKLPSGRTVRLRGRWDAVDLIGRGREAGVWLQENKTKSDVREGQIRRQLTFDLQTMLYLTALYERLETETAANSLFGRDYGQVLGVRYNVVRRPLSGGKGSIVRHKGRPARRLKSGKMSPGKPDETREHFYGRVREIIADSPEEFFMRWEVAVSREDVAKFRRECLDPILEQLCNWWNHVKSGSPFDHTVEAGDNVHWRHPFGVYNVLDEGGSSDVDEYLATGSTVGLERTENLFPEL